MLYQQTDLFMVFRFCRFDMFDGLPGRYHARPILQNSFSRLLRKNKMELKPKTKRLKPEKLKAAQVMILSRGTTQTIEDKNESILNMPTTTARSVLIDLGYRKIREEQRDRWTQIEIWELPEDKQTPN